MATLVVVGSGSLARSVCGSLAARDTGPTRLVLVGRDRGRAEEAAYLTAARAAAADRPPRVESAAVDAGTGELADLLARVRPDGVLVCASPQSPWEARGAPNGWTALLAAGFGLTLPFQAWLARRVGLARAAAAPGAWLVNACFPDAVNPLLAALDVPVLCGVGNVATVAASLRAGLADAGRADAGLERIGLERIGLERIGLERVEPERVGPERVGPGRAGRGERGTLRVIGHHLHLHRPVAEADEALAYLDDEPVTGVSTLLEPMRAADRAGLNQVHGAGAATVLAGLLAGRPVRASLPGPLGLPGGYPVLLRDGSARLDLPAGVTRAEAVARNQRWALLDGVRVAAGRAEYAPAVATALADHLPDLAGGFAATDLDPVVGELSALRDRLRRCPAPPTPPRERP